MIAFYIIMGVILFLLLLLLMPMGLQVSFRDELTVRVRYMFVPFTIYPRKEKDKPEKMRESEEK